MPRRKETLGIGMAAQAPSAACATAQLIQFRFGPSVRVHPYSLVPEGFGVLATKLSSVPNVFGRTCQRVGSDGSSVEDEPLSPGMLPRRLRDTSYEILLHKGNE